MVANCPFVNRNGEAAEVAREVADATPKTGVTKVGEVALTTLPEPTVEISSTVPDPAVTRPNTLSVALTS